MRLRAAKVFVEDHFETRELWIRDGRIYFSGAETEPCLDFGDSFLLPGLTDLHVHGAMNADFCDASRQSLETFARYEASVGVTQICPATMTVDSAQLERIFALAGATEADSLGGARFVGIHMEGPYLSPQKLGAQNPAYVARASSEELAHYQKLAGAKIKIISIAPEMPGALDFIEQNAGQYICSLAHSCADYDTAAAALQKGARHVTHLFNAMPPLHHREPGIIGAASDCAEARIELIADGIHLHPSIIRLAFRLFADRICLISDSMRATGLADGVYELGGQTVTVCGRKAVLENGTIAGSATNLADCVRHAVSCGIALNEAIRAASFTPAVELGISQDVGIIQEGRRANLLIWNTQLEQQAVYLNGQRYY